MISSGYRSSSDAGGTIKRIEFDSLSDLAAYANDAPKTDRESSWAKQSGYEWDGGLTRNAAVAMAQHGWIEGAEKAKKLLDSIPDTLPRESVTSETFYDVTGAFVDVPVALEGRPECMVDFREDKRTMRFAHIVVAGCYSGGYDADTIMTRGICIAAIVDALESRGVRCEVELLTRQWSTWEVSVPLKRAHEPLNLETLVYAVAHPATFRRLVFAICEREPEAIRARYGFHTSGTYGTVAPMTEYQNRPDVLLFPPMHLDHGWTPTDAARRVKAALERFCKEG